MQFTSPPLFASTTLTSSGRSAQEGQRAPPIQNFQPCRVACAVVAKICIPHQKQRIGFFVATGVTPWPSSPNKPNKLSACP